jgi:uncharacterized protein YbbK (DUF523 family)
MEQGHAPALRLGISACLVGEPVRYDGTHRLDFVVQEALGGSVHWVAVCPEVEFGLGVPRPIIRLERHAGGVRVTQPATERDLTAELDAWCDARVAELDLPALDGFILKARSPSCGLVGVKSYAPDGSDERADGEGRFAAALRRNDPDLPLIDEAQFADAAARDAFTAAAALRQRRQRSRARPDSR